jgi:hypothetical protein
MQDNATKSAPAAVWYREAAVSTVRVAAVQAAYVLMDQQATLAKATALLETAAAERARIVVFPEVFIPGTPIWFDSGRIWHGDEQWYAMLVDQATVVHGPVTEQLGSNARAAGRYVSSASTSASRTARRSTTPPCTSGQMATFSPSIASSSRPGPNARCGEWATGPITSVVWEHLPDATPNSKVKEASPEQIVWDFIRDHDGEFKK